MSQRPSPQCLACVRWTSPLDDPANVDVADPVQTCVGAFPDGIPMDIWNNQVDHRQAVDGDHGLQFDALRDDEFPEWALQQAASTPAALLPGPVDRTYKRDKDGRFGSGGGGGGAEHAAPTITETASVAALPRMEIPSVTEAAKGTNPHYGAAHGGPVYRDAARAGKNWDPSMGPPPSGAYEENCTNAVQGFEMRMRGYDVEAAPLHVLDKYGYAAGRTYPEADEQLASSWTLPGGAPHGRSFGGQSWRSFKEIDAEVQSWPEGGRGYMTTGKHVFSVVKSGGKARYIEAQYDSSPTRDMTKEYKKKYKSEPFGSPPKTEEAKVVRLDDLEPTDAILSSVVAKS